MSAIPSPDWETIEAVSLYLATYGCFPVKLCRVTDHSHKDKDGVARPCRTPGKRPEEGGWEKGSREKNLPLLDAWRTMGYNVGNVITAPAVGMDEDVPGGLDKWFEELGEGVPHTLADEVPLTGKRHFIVLRNPNVPGELAGDFRLNDGTVVGELARDGHRQFVTPGNVWRGPNGEYDVRKWNGVEVVATLSEAATRRMLVNGGYPSLTSGETPRGGEWLWDEAMGSRHNLIVKEARRLAGSVRNPELLYLQMLDWTERHGMLGQREDTGRWTNEQEVRDACDSALRKYDEDPAPITLLVPRAGEEVRTEIRTEELFVNVLDYHAQNSAIPTYVSPLAAYGTVTLVSGPPKGGKSTLISNLLGAREAGTVFLWGNPVPKGPMTLITEEGGYPVVRKTQGLTSLDILDRTAFAGAGLRSLGHLLAALDAWLTDDPALVVIDTLAVWGDIKDENDAVAATKAITTLRVWAQSTGSAVVLVHHTRKGGGDHGEAIRGSGGIFAAVDQSVELAFTNDKQSDDRGLDIAGRLSFGETKTLAFDRDTMTYSVTTTVYADPYPIDKFPTTTSGQPGLTRQDAEAIWGVSQSKANAQLKALVDAGRLTKTMVQDGRNWRGDYHRVVVLDLSADTRSVGERMAGLFEQSDAATLPPYRGQSSVAASDPVGPAPDEESGSSDT